MILAIIFSHLWGILQLLALTALTRTIRMRTVLASFAAGLYTCSTVAVLLQFAWTRVFAAFTRRPLYEVVSAASYTLDPFIEETVKVLPMLLLLWFIPRMRQQWSVADCILIGAATGSGFGLAENLYWFGNNAHRFIPINGGWELPALSSNVVLSFAKTMSSWLPSAVASEYSLTGAPLYDPHLVWSALCGLAIGLALLTKTEIARRVAVALFLFAGLSHAAWNAPLRAPSAILLLFFSPFHALLKFGWCLPVAALVVAFCIDRSRQCASAHPDLTLAFERQNSFPFFGIIQAAFLRPPLTIAWTAKFVRLRRTYWTAAKTKTENTPGLFEQIQFLRNRIESVQALRKPLVPFQFAKLLPAALHALRQPKAMLAIVLLLPSFIWLGIGGFPQTAWLQSALMSGPIWLVVRLISLISLIWMGSHLAVGSRRWRQMTRRYCDDEVAGTVFRLLSGLGALALGIYALVLAAIGAEPAGHLLTNFHVLECIAGAVVIGVLLTAVAGIALFPIAEVALDVASSALEADLAQLQALVARSVLSEVSSAGEMAEASSLGAEASSEAGEVALETKVDLPMNFNDQPVFQSLHDFRLPDNLVGPDVSDEVQMRAATKELKSFLIKNPDAWDNFTEPQQLALKKAFGNMESDGVSSTRIAGFTWNHNDMDEGVLQLVDRAEHAAPENYHEAAGTAGWVKR